MVVIKERLTTKKSGKLNSDTMAQTHEAKTSFKGASKDESKDNGCDTECPFCGISGISSAELLIHVNQDHLDFMTPENELMSYIDDQTPSVDDDSDEMANGKSLKQQGNRITEKCPDSISCNGNELPSNGIDNDSPGKENQGVRNKETVGTSTPVQNVNGGAGSPLRSSLVLKLKANKPSPIILSPFQCPMCPSIFESAQVLEEHVNRSHFDPASPSVNNTSNGASSSSTGNTLTALQCPICSAAFERSSDLEIHVNVEHRDILSPAHNDKVTTKETETLCPVCTAPLKNMTTKEMELHIEEHFPRSPQNSTTNDLGATALPAQNTQPLNETEKERIAKQLREQEEFQLLRAQYGMDDQGNFREQSAAAMQRAVYAGEMSVTDYYERQVGLRAAESHGIDDGTSCTRSVSPRVQNLSASLPGVVKSYVCNGVDHYASSYGDKGWGCGYRNLQMLLSSLLQNTLYNEALYSAWGTQAPSRMAMPSISRLQKMVEAAWAQGFDVQGSEQLGCKLFNTRKWIGATEVVTLFSWLRINCQLVDFHRPTGPDGRHPELFNWVLQYFEENQSYTPPLYLQHQGHSRTIIGIEQKVTGLTLLVLDPSHSPRQMAALGSSQESLRLIRRTSAAMRDPQYQIVAVRGLIDTEDQYQASKVLRSLRIPPDP